MKKTISFLVIGMLFTISTYAQNFVMPQCSCTPPANSTCSSDCLFSSCCVCWNPNTQTGACGCYWGVATCRNESNSQALVSTTNFGSVSPDSKIKFSFEKFSLLFDYFRSKDIRASSLDNAFQNIRSKYQLTGEKITVSNNDFAQILVEYSNLIDSLTAKQKEELNMYIKSLKQ